MSFHAMKKKVLFTIIIFLAPGLIFFVTGYIFYKPPKAKPLADSLKMPIEKIAPNSMPISDSMENSKGQKGGDQLSSTALLFPRVHRISGEVQVATRYAGLLAQIDSMLTKKNDAQAPAAFADCQQRSTARDHSSDRENDETPMNSRLEEMILVRLTTINDVLKYVSSQVGVTTDLLAAVAWAESKMLPYAINVEGKTYYFTSKKQALAALNDKDIGSKDVDIGLFQINYRHWGKPLGIKKEDLLDVGICSLIGAMILKYNLQLHSDPWVAIGKYHSRYINKMRPYQAKVSRGLVIIRALTMNAPERRESQTPGKT
jgi:hypothetical protein